MLDLFAGVGGASEPMIDRGWVVDRVEINERISPKAMFRDVRLLEPERDYYDLIWASPPCTEFSRESMPWSRTGKTPSLELLHATLRIIREARPRWYAIENVRGAIKYFNPVLGAWRDHVGSCFLWGDYPEVCWPTVEPHKGKHRSPRLRSKVPYEIGLSLALACERSLTR